MKKIMIVMMMVIFMAVISTISISVASSTEKVKWEEFNQGINYQVISDLSTNKHRLEMRNTYSETPEKIFTVNLGKGENIYILDSNVTFFYEEEKIALLYHIDGKPHFIIASIENDNLSVYRIRDIYYYRIPSYRVFENKIYLQVEWWNKNLDVVIEGYVRVYTMPDEINYQETARYQTGDHEVVWGREEVGCDETFQTGVIVGISPIEYYQPRVMNVFNAKTGKRIESFIIPPKSKIEYLCQTFCGKGGEYELVAKQMTWKDRTWKGVKK